MLKRWVIPDIHGCVKTLQALIEEQIRPGREDALYFLGDYIDRGPDSKGVIDYIMSLRNEEYTVTTLKGNHEDILVGLYEGEPPSKITRFFKSGNRQQNMWLAMGGKETLKSFRTRQISGIPAAYIEWLRSLEYYIVLDDYILVHAGLNFSIEDPFTDLRSMLWIREYTVDPGKTGNRKLVHGHVPVNLELIDLSIKNNFYKFIDLDNGPYLQGKDGFGNLVALELNERRMVIQENRDF
jgi:serine/threonine protein phosphatase 1